jgi:hypothetical protein
MTYTMSKPVHQHFIPRSYLNNFAINDSGSKLIFAKHKEGAEIKKISTKDICVDKNLYTLPTDDESKKFDLEHFYAENIDAVLPLVYSVLKDTSIITIDFETRLKIITTILGLYFRTPKFLKAENQLFKDLLKKKLDEDDAEMVIVEFLGKNIKISRSEAKEVVKEFKENNRIRFLYQHLQSYEKFVQSKLSGNITVLTIADDSEFITSDNPVVIRPYADPTIPDFSTLDYLAQEIDPFDPLNMIQVALDPKTILIILPHHPQGTHELLQRGQINLHDVLMYNSETERNSEQWILGTEHAIPKHLKEQAEFAKPTPENLAAVGDYINRTLQFAKLMKILEQHGLKGEEVKAQINIMKDDPYILKDPNFQKYLRMIGD